VTRSSCTYRPDLTPGRPSPAGLSSPAELVDAARAGAPRAVARLISLLEDGSPQLREVMALLAPHARGAQVIGLTGAPGVGKSTTTAALVAAYRARGLRVGVLAVDPSSPFSGGALLGDRVRMQDYALDAGVFIRSMASRGHLGGLAWATPQALRVLDAAGYDVILVETVGVGQAELDIASLADTTVVLMAPGMGDGIQAAKAGLLEIADVFVVNKADRDGAAQTARDLRQMVSASTRETRWRPPVLELVAIRAEGISAVVDAITEHARWLDSSGERQLNRARRVADEIAQIALTQLRLSMGDLRDGSVLGDLAVEVAQGRSDPYTAADALLTRLGRGGAATPTANPAGPPGTRSRTPVHPPE
jgi:LAO/AO transport system kinase